MCSPHSPDLSGFAALLAASSSAQKTITRAGATSCPCLHSSPLLMPARPLVSSVHWSLQSQGKYLGSLLCQHPCDQWHYSQGVTEREGITV